MYHLLLALTISCSTGPMDAPAPCRLALDPAWNEMLSLALEQTPEARRRLEAFAEKPPTDVHRKLAEALLEEWNLSANSTELSRPRLILLPKLDRSGLPREFHGRPPVVPIKATIDQHGCVTSATLYNSPTSDGWKSRALEAFKSAIFRPARSDGRYEASSFQAVVTFHIREDDQPQ